LDLGRLFIDEAANREEEAIEFLLPLSLSRSRSLSSTQNSGTGGRILVLAFLDGEGAGVLVAEGG